MAAGFAAACRASAASLAGAGVAQDQLAAMADQEAVDVERQRLAVGDAGQPRAVVLVDAKDDVVIAVQHAVRHGGDGEFADLLRAHAARCQRGLAADHVGGLLRHHQHAGVDMGGDEVGHRRGVDHAEPLDAMDAELRIDHGVGPVPMTQVEAGWLAVAATLRIQLSISASVFTFGPGDSLRAAEARKRRLGRDLAGDLEALAQASAGRSARRGIRDDLHLVARVVRAQQHLAAAVGMQQAGPDAVAVGIRLLPAREPQRGGGRRAAEHELDIGHRPFRTRLDEGMQAPWNHGGGPGAEHPGAHHVERHLVEPHVVAELAPLGAGEHHQHREMVLEVFARPAGR